MANQRRAHLRAWYWTALAILVTEGVAPPPLQAQTKSTVGAATAPGPLEVGQRVRISVAQAQVRDGQNVIARVAQGEEFAVIALAGDNVGIKVQGRTGWVSRKDVQVVAVPAPPPPQKAAPASPKDLREKAAKCMELAARLQEEQRAGRFDQAMELRGQVRLIETELLAGLRQSSPRDERVITSWTRAHIETLKSVARDHQAKEDWAPARAALQEAIELQTELLGAKHYQTDDTHRAVAFLDLVEKLSPTQRKDLQRARSLSAQASALQGQGQFRQASPLAEQALAIDRAVLGEKHPTTANSFSRLGTLLYLQGDYKGARPHTEQTLAIRKEVLGEKHADTATSLNNLGLLLQAERDLAGAQARFEQALGVYKEVLGPKHQHTAAALHNLGNLFKDRGDFAAARRYLEEALAIQEEVLGKKDPSTFNYRSKLGTLLMEHRDFAAARRHFEQTLAIRKETLGEKHQETASALEQLGRLDFAQSDYAAGQSKYERALAIKREVLGEKHPEVAKCHAWLGILHSEKAEYAAAQSHFEQALAIQREVFGEKHAETVTSLTSLGIMFKHQADYLKARACMEQALARCREVQGEKHPLTASILNGLGAVLDDQGDYSGAQAYYEQSLAIRKEMLGKHKDTAESYNNLGLLLRKQGDQTAARPYLEQAVAINREVIGPKHPATANSIISLGGLFQEQGDYASAQSLFEQSLAIHREVFGEKHPRTATSHNSLGSLLQAQGDYPAARPHLEQALAIRKEVLGGKHPDTATSFNNLATLLYVQREYSAAQPYQEQALAITREVFGEKHPETAKRLCNLGSLLYAQHDYLAARPYLEQALSVRKAVLGEKHPDTALAQLHLSILLARAGEGEAAVASMDQARRVIRRHVDHVLPALSEAEQLGFLQTTDSRNFYVALSLGLRYPERSETSAGWLLNGKGLTQEALAQRARLARDSRDPALAQVLRQLQGIREQLAQRTIKGPGKDPSRYRQELAQLEVQEQQLSRQLGQAKGQVVRDDPWVELEQVRQALPAGSILVELARFVNEQSVFDRKLKGAAPRYAAWLIPPAGEGDVELLDLGEAAVIEAAVAAYQREIEAAGKQILEEGEKEAEALVRKPLAELSRMVLAPLLPRIGKKSRWIVSPDAALWLVPWGALPLEDGRYALEQHSISYLTSGRDLAASTDKLQPTATSLVLADPDFNLAAGGPTSDPSSTRGDSRTSRSGVSNEWSRLAGTAQEAAVLAPHLKKFVQHSPQVFLGDKALEGIVKRAERPRIAVLSTHGFFLSDQELPTGGGEVLALSDSPATPRATNLENPLLRCGLVFAGANQRTQRAAGADDGILTGLEIVGADFRGTELVVLSACETGLGKVNNGEGVAGLRQAFQLAGAETVIATLWKIPDQETAALMSVFWQELAQGADKADALRRAQLSVIRDHRTKDQAAHPFFWAAFTLTGQTRFANPTKEAPAKTR